MTESSTQQRIDAQADATVRSLTAGIEPDAEEPIQRGDVYDVVRTPAIRYLIGGGGPSSFATVISDGEEDLVLVEVSGWSERAFRVIHGRTATRIGVALAAAAKESS